MDAKIQQYVIARTQDLINAFSCSAEAKTAAQSWLKAVGTETEAAETLKFIAELEEDIMPIEQLIGFADSEDGARIFGAEKSKEVAAHGREIQSAGAKYCDCPACLAAADILDKRDALLS